MAEGDSDKGCSCGGGAAISGLWRRNCPLTSWSIDISTFLQGADPNSIDDGGLPALSLAVTNKCPLPLVQALLAAGADADGVAPTGSPLQVVNNTAKIWQTLKRS